MGQSKISRRLIYSLLIMIFFSMFSLGWYLLHFFYQENLEEQERELLRSGVIIQSLLDEDKSGTNVIIPAKLQAQLSSMVEEAHYRMTIIDLHGNVLTDTAENNLENHFSRKEVQSILAGANMGKEIRYSKTLGYNMLYVALPIRNDKQELIGVLRMSESLQEVENTYKYLRNTVVGALALTIVLMLIISLVLTHYQTKPIHLMTREAEEILDGNLNKRLSITAKDELAVLGNTINELTEKLIQQIQETKALAHQQQLILANTDNIIMLVNWQGEIIMANEVAVKLLAFREVKEGKNLIRDLGLTKLADLVRQAIQTKKRSQHLVNLVINNNPRSFDIFLAPLKEYDYQQVLCVFHDVSLLQNIALRQQEFVSNAAHELSTPLTSIMGYAETILDNKLCDNVYGLKFISIMDKEAKRMDQLLKALLQLAKLENKDYQETLAIDVIRVEKLMEQIINLVTPMAEAKRQDLTVKLANKGLAVKGNYALLVQAIYNIVDNAIKYTAEKGKISIEVKGDGDLVGFSVQDNGMGIDGQALPLIFERFYRSDKHRSRALGGNGIGLSLAKFIVELFGGTIKVESTPGVGSCFMILLPLNKV